MFRFVFYNYKLERYFTKYSELVKYLKEVINEDLEEKNLKEYLEEIQNDDSEISYYSPYYLIEKINTDKYFEREYAWNGDLAIGGGKKHLKEVFPDLDSEVLEKLYKKWDKYIGYIMKNECCVNSFRIGRVDDEKSMKEYKKLKTCCGSDDTKIDINGIEFMFGCNFGH